MTYGVDARVLCGQDVRRSAMWPTDSARADAFIAEYGGTLSVMPVGNVAIALQWENEIGELRTITAASVSEGFHKLRQSMCRNHTQD
jgi:hypothetical protein